MKIFKCNVNARFWAWMVIISLFAGLRSATALENGVGRTPAMGWNPWNTWLTNFNLPLLKEVMDSMVTNGMRNAGYTYMGCDGGSGIMGSDATIQEFINYGHGKGFKVGLYVNNNRGNELNNVTKWARMGFDYLKHDDYWIAWDATPTYIRMRDALKNCGRPVYYTIHPSNFAPRPDTICNAERVSGDISWKANNVPWGLTKDNGIGVMGEVMESRKHQHLAKPGYFNDMDMMGVGIQTLTTEEARTHFGLWCIMASLLIEGSDVRKIEKDRLEILLNREVIAVNQDSLGEQGRVVWSRYTTTDSVEVISKRMKDSSRAVMLFNRNGPTKSITVRLSDIGLAGTVHVRDLWRHVNLPDATDSVTITGIASHGCAMLRISKNPVASVYPDSPKPSVQKSAATHAVTQCLFNTNNSIGIRLSPKHSGLQVFNLHGTLLWEMHQPGVARESLIRLPSALKRAGMVVVRFIN